MISSKPVRNPKKKCVHTGKFSEIIAISPEFYSQDHQSWILILGWADKFLHFCEYQIQELTWNN